MENISVRNVSDRLQVVKHLKSTVLPSFEESVIEGIIQKHSGKRTMEFRFFYDDTGSDLFEQITDTSEYYLTRCETQLLKDKSRDIAQYMLNTQSEADKFHGKSDTEGSILIELGSGSSTKTSLIINEFINVQKNLTYVPIDISGQILVESSLKLLERFPELKIDASHGLYEQGIQYASKKYYRRSKIITFLGSSIGNFTKEEEISFLKLILSKMSKFDSLLVGFDLKKDPKVLEAAYDDSLRVTANFNLNLLRRVNRELGGNFDISKWKHAARWIEKESRIEMRLVSLCNQKVQIKGIEVEFAEGEEIHTENCHKYSHSQVEKIAHEAGYEVARFWVDDSKRFSLAILKPRGSTLDAKEEKIEPVNKTSGVISDVSLC